MEGGLRLVWGVEGSDKEEGEGVEQEDLSVGRLYVTSFPADCAWGYSSMLDWGLSRLCQRW